MQVVCGLKEDLEVAQNEFNRLQQEADSRVLAKSNAASGPSSSEGAPHPQTLERPPNEQRSSGEVRMDSAKCFLFFFSRLEVTFILSLLGDGTI